VKEQQEITTFTLKVPPGLFTEQTARGLVYQTTVEQYNRIGQGRWKDGNFVRFHNGLPQKVGGWVGLNYTGDINSGNVIGVPRSLKKWAALNGQELEAFASAYKLYLLNGGSVYDITPQRRQVTLGTKAIITTSGSNVVQVVDYQHGAQTGDYVLFTGGTAVGGIQFSTATFTGNIKTLVAAAQTTTGGTPLTLTTSPYVLPAPQFLTLSSTSNFSGINFTIVGTNQETGASQTEVLTGPNNGTVSSTNVYASITSITPTTTSGNTISAGFAFAAGTYQIKVAAYSSTNAICATQGLTNGTPMTKTSSPYVMAGAGFLSITSSANLAGVTFTIVGLGPSGAATSEQLLGPAAGLTVTSANAYTSVTSITPNATGNTASVGFYFPAGSAFTFNAAMPATSTAIGGGAPVLSYDISSGLDNPGYYYGWGSGTWGQDTWGTARTSSTMVQPIRLWSLDNWGQDLMASPRQGPVYYWDYNLGFSTKAQNISQVIAAGANVLDGPPTSNQRILVSPDSQQLVCLGGDHDGVQDPLYIITSDNADYTDFTVSSTNNVYDARLSSGSFIQTGIRTRTGIVIFTDISAYIMTAVGGDSIYSITQVGENLSIVGPNAVAEVSGVLYLMGTRKFYMYDSIIQEIPCDVWTYVFDNTLAATRGYGGINLTLGDKVTCWYNDQWSEVWWFYPSYNATENDTYVCFNYREKHWTYGKLDRTVGITTSQYYAAPLCIDANGAIWQHEVGVDSVNVNGIYSAIQPYLYSYDYQVDDGGEVVAFSRVVNDTLQLTGTLNLQIYSKRYPADAYTASRVIPITTGTDKTDIRGARGKLVSFHFSSSNVGDNWRTGYWTFDAQNDGER
jgi:hypothetical protein